MTHNLDVEQLLAQMAEQLRALLASRQLEDPLLIGIHTGGVWLAERLHQLLALPTPLGTLDISFYRDDFTQAGLNPKVQPSAIPLATEGRHLILVDDVLKSGRTVRAALNELFDFGRPASVTFATLIDLDSRELPIQADVVGQHLQLSENQYIKLTGPTPLRLELQERG